jgi:hypothetical protein
VIEFPEFMSKPVVYLKELERVGDVIETLQVIRPFLPSMTFLDHNTQSLSDFKLRILEII